MSAYSDGQYPSSAEDKCIADEQFIEWFCKKEYYHKRVFHFGSGYHHKVGIELARSNSPVMAVTISKFEHDRYVELLRENPALANHYKLLHCNIYSLDARLLPKFDIINLFHLCEYAQHNSGVETYNDTTLLEMFVYNSIIGALILLFRGSNAFDKAVELMNVYVRRNKVILVDIYKSLSIYKVSI